MSFDPCKWTKYVVNQPTNQLTNQLTDWQTKTNWSRTRRNGTFCKTLRILKYVKSMRTTYSPNSWIPQKNYNNLDHTNTCAPRDCTWFLLLQPFRLVIFFCFLIFTICFSFAVTFSFFFLAAWLADMFVLLWNKRRRTDKYAVNESKSAEQGVITSLMYETFPILSRTLYVFFSLVFTHK